MLQNAYFLAKFGFDTAENRPEKNCRIIWKKLQKENRRAHCWTGSGGAKAGSGGAKAGSGAAKASGESGANCWRVAMPPRREVNNSLIIVNFFHKIQNFWQISDLFSQI